MPRSCSLPILTALFVISAGGQQKSDFSGAWKLIGSPDRVYIDQIERQDPHLKVFGDIGGSARNITVRLSFEHTYVTDGTEKECSTTKGGQQWTTAFWRGPALILMDVEKDSYRVTVTRETWVLSDTGNTLTKTKRLINMDEVLEGTRVFERQ